MKIADASLVSLSSYSQSRKHNESRKDKEPWEDYEERTWRLRQHVAPDGHVFIPPMSFAFSIQTAAQYLSMPIPGKGQSKYTKHFKSGIIVPEGPVLPDLAAEVRGEWFDMHANGRRGSGTRVPRCYPMIDHWEAEVTYYVLDDQIPTEVFEYHLREAGNFIGIGRFRPENGGFNGRFRVEQVTWRETA